MNLIVGKDISITLVELAPTVGGRLFGKPAKDIYSLIRLPSRAIDLLAAILRENGYTNVRAINPYYPRVGSGEPGHLNDEELKAIFGSDFVGISSITRTAPQSFELADLVREHAPTAKIVFGGPHFLGDPAEALEHGHIVVPKEGDQIIVELAQRIEEHRENPHLSDVKGIYYKTKEGEIKWTGGRSFLTPEELTNLPFPSPPKEVLNGINYNIVLNSRGCPEGCHYCAVIVKEGGKYRFVDVDRSIDILEKTIKQNDKPVFFGSDNFAADMDLTKQFLEEIVRRGINLRGGAQIRVDAAKDEEFLKLAKKAGMHTFFIGFESMNPETLKKWNKGTTPEDNIYAVETLHAHGFRIHGMFMLGSEYDTVKDLYDIADFAKSNCIETAQFFAPVPLPGTQMAREAERKGRILTKKWHLYDGQHVLIEPVNMSASELQDHINKISCSFYSGREAMRFLFKAPANKIFGFTMRLEGKSLANNIYTDSANPHKESLAQLDEWKSRINDSYRYWLDAAKEALAKKAKPAEMQKYMSQLYVNANQSLGRLREDASTLYDKYKSYITISIDQTIKKLEEQHAAFLEKISPKHSGTNSK